MDLQFEQPIFLKLLFLLPIIWGLSFLAFRRLPLWRIVSSAFLRSLVLALLILVLAGIHRVDEKPSDLALVFCVDVSDSISQENKTWVADYLKEMDKKLDDDDKNIKRALVVFGSDARVASPMAGGLETDYGELELDTTRTNIANGMLSALKLFPEDSVKKMVLLTDGNENLGSSVLASSIIEQKNTHVYTVEIPPPPTVKEVLIKKLLVPQDVNHGETFDIRIMVENRNDFPVEGSVSLSEGENLLSRWELSFPAGFSVFEMPYKGEEKGFIEFHADLELDTDADTNDDNNRKRAAVNVVGKPRILYVRGDPSKRAFLAGAIEEKDVVVEMGGIDIIPKTLNEMLEYECIVFSNVPASAVSRDQMEAVKTYVRDFGGGFIMVGGENSYAQGGYKGTPIEDVLPVNVIAGATRKEKKPKRASIILLVDKSGSMTGKKIFATKKATIELLKQLKEGDQVGLIAFDVVPHVVIELGPVQKIYGKDLLAKLSTLSAGGGTDIFPAMKEAYNRLSKSGAKVNHIILLSDGNTRSVYYSYEALMDKLKRANISISTIAIGGWLVNTRLLKDIAKRTGGQFYRLKNINELPRLVVLDADAALTRADFHEETFIPRIDPSSEILKGFSQEQIPPLQGYSLTRAKASAEVPVFTEIKGRPDPILANWRYGLGKSVAYTSDAEARWSSKWVNWSKYNKFWSQTVRWAMRDKPKGSYVLKVDESEGKRDLIIESGGDWTEGTQLQARIISGDSGERELNLRQIAPKRYTASLEGLSPGSYTVNLSRLEGGKVVDRVTKGVLVPTKKELASVEDATRGNNTGLLETIAQRTGGKFKPMFEDITANTEMIFLTEDLSKYLIPIAMGLLLCDIAIRRIGIV
ncbi:MAG: VWA domain-containing protein [Candidatus Brocadiales bacterium]|nr:VWA domain-containing protein [Candidatus Bathyanammoxibius sp.]